jgi:hypothetical protein
MGAGNVDSALFLSSGKYDALGIIGLGEPTRLFLGQRALYLRLHFRRHIHGLSLVELRGKLASVKYGGGVEK